ncbi:hypothetical protein COLO4_15987 [Corchorus olitorius]|uniref:EF-hand domain-containing protein n=1 Tax=Corchorus olitorius TaxID=93759 RepID=A0A1R3JKD3_9ROSI|nr:hypothetical protein COLO4_15987 [Corchorus olitorius]
MSQISQLQQLRKMAEAYYESASRKVKKAADTFFKEMDFDDNEVVELSEFMEFMREEPNIAVQYTSCHFFHFLCKLNKNHLDFLDVMTLFYIIQSGRPFCATCGDFIMDTYFCCTQCFFSRQKRYCVCFKCYEQKEYRNHDHPGDQFLDNFAFLEFCKRNHHDTRPSSSYQMITDKNDGTLAIPPQPTSKLDKRKREKLSKALEKVVSLIHIGGAIAQISTCSIQ